MSRRYAMVGRALLPGVGISMLALLAQPLLGGLDPGTHPLPAVYAAARWVPLAGLMAGVALAAHATWRLLRWSTGDGPACSACAGMLGRMRVGQHGTYRRCVACAKHNSRNARKRYAYTGADSDAG